LDGEACCGQANACRIHRNRTEEILPDNSPDLTRNLRCLREFCQIVAELEYIATFAGGFSAGTHRNADSGLSKRGRIVKAVADHPDDITRGAGHAGAGPGVERLDATRIH
jgi:hypothetical protein